MNPQQLEAIQFWLVHNGACSASRSYAAGSLCRSCSQIGQTSHDHLFERNGFGLAVPAIRALGLWIGEALPWDLRVLHLASSRSREGNGIKGLFRLFRQVRILPPQPRISIPLKSLVSAGENPPTEMALWLELASAAP